MIALSRVIAFLTYFQASLNFSECAVNPHSVLMKNKRRSPVFQTVRSPFYPIHGGSIQFWKIYHLWENLTLPRL